MQREAKIEREMLWGVLLHLGTNMWGDVPVKRWGVSKPSEYHYSCQAAHLRFDDDVWFYGDKLEGLKPGSYHEELVSAFGRLDAAGFDQVPCGSNWQHDENFGKLVAYNRKTIAPSRLRGFLMAPWFFTVAPFEERLKRCIDLVAAARADEAAAVRNVE